MAHNPNKIAHRWMTLILMGVIVIFLRVLWELINLHVLIPRSPTYRERKYDNTYELLGLRGRILDRNGVVLAESVSGREVAIDAKDPALEKVDRDTMPIELAELLGISQEKLFEAFASGRRYTKICTITDDALIHELQRRKDPLNKTDRIAGVSIATTRSVRAYPNGARLCHVLGFVNHDGEGVYGIEQRFNSELAGVNGMVHAVYDGRRREIRSRRIDEVQPTHGNDIYLTIDNNIQYIIETALSNALSHFQAESGTIIVQHVKTGEILGMATLPSFKPQEFNKHQQDEWKNNAISRCYEPGSVMKAITVAMALQMGIITEHTVFDVGTSGIWYYAGKPLRDRVYGKITPRELLMKSSNIGTAQIGLLMAQPAPDKGMPLQNELLWRSFNAMGLGKKTGIELVGEETGIFWHYKSKAMWNKLSPTRIPLGQSISVTAIQLVNAYATIGNGGYLMQPTILKEIRSHEGELLRANKPIVLGRPLTQNVCNKMLDMLQSVTQKQPGNNGTGWRANLPSYTVAGKTGTGQIPINGHYNHSDYNVSFIGVYPATRPELAILVTIEKPRGSVRSGGGVSAPTFASVAEEIGRYLGIPADKAPVDK
jgi:cell division protein FtsI/penicillin-binding protein 2